MSEKKADTSVPNLDQLDAGWEDDEGEDEDDLDQGWDGGTDDETEESRASDPPGLSLEEREARAAARKERARAKAAAKKERRRARALAAASTQKTKQTKRQRNRVAPPGDREESGEGRSTARTVEPRTLPHDQRSAQRRPSVRRDWQRMGLLVALVVIFGGVLVFLLRR